MAALTYRQTLPLLFAILLSACASKPQPEQLAGYEAEQNNEYRQAAEAAEPEALPYVDPRDICCARRQSAT